MTRAEFVTAVVADIAFEDPRDAESVACAASQLHADGYTVAEARRFVRCLEEVNPDIDEATALHRMAAIARAVYARKASQEVR